MKRSIKKLLASLLAVAMLAGLVPLGAMAETDTSFVFGTGTYGSFRSQGIPGVQLGGIGGKAEDDMAMAFVVDSEFNGQESRWQYPTTHIAASDVGTSGGSQGIYYSFNMYADGNVVVSVGYGSGLSILKWNPDGSLNVPNVSGAVSAERGKWHKVVVSQNDSSGGRLALFIDGVRIGTSADAGWSGWGSKTPLLFGVLADSANGVAAFDDPYITLWNSGNTYYKNMSQDTIAPVDSETIDFDNDAKSLVYNYSIADTSALADAIKTAASASEVTICDENLSVTENLADAKYAVIKNQANAYHYYSISELEKPVMEKVQLEEAADDTTTADDNWKTNVNFYDEAVAVYSHTENPTWQITSDALLGALSSKTGYELSYVDENKEPATTDHVTGGYLKAVKDDETLYIPIVKQYDYSTGFKTAAEANVNVKYRNAYGHTIINSASNVAGNPASAFGFSVKPGSTSEDRHDIYMISDVSNSSSFVVNKTCTYVFNMYAEDDAVLSVGYRKGTKLFDWNPDGSVYVYRWVGGTNAKDATPFMNLERGKWHQVAFTIERASSRGELYIDGVHYENPELLPVWNMCSGISLCMGKLSEGYAADATGRVLFSDVEYYEGMYYNYGETIEAKSSTVDFAIDTDAKVIYYQNMDLAALKAAVLANTDASAVKVYTDATISAEAAELSAASVVFTTSENGMRYEYYTLKPYSEIPAPVLTVTPGTSTYKVSTKYITDLTGYTLYAASYTSDNTLVGVTAYPVEADDLYKNLEFKLAYGDGGTKVKAFLWDDENTPLSFAQYDPEA